MALSELRSRAKRMLRHYLEKAATIAVKRNNGGEPHRRPIAGNTRRLRYNTTTRTTTLRHNSYSRYNNNNNNNRSTGLLDVARFGLVSIATLPFSLWIAMYSYDYYYRVHHCREALTNNRQPQHDNHKNIESNNKNKNSKQKGDKQHQHHHNDNHHSNTSSSLIGREDQLAQVQALLQNPSPHQIVVVAGPNESGKSRFVSELIRRIQNDPTTSTTTNNTQQQQQQQQQQHHHQQQGVTYIQLAQTTIVDSLSTLTHAFVDAFDLRWLQLRHALVDVLPFAGSEILVMKERFSDRDFVQALSVVTKALEGIADAEDEAEVAEAASNNNTASTRRRRRPPPVIIVDGLGESGGGSAGSGWIRRSPEGRRSLQRLLKWCIYVTKERGLAHVILTGNEELVIGLTDQNRMTRGHVKVIGLGDLDTTTTTTTTNNNTNTNNNRNIKNTTAGQIILQECPTATPDEIQKITDTFGGFIHDLHDTSRQIQYELKAVKNHRGGDTNYDTYDHDDDRDDDASEKKKKKKQTKAKRAQIIDQVLSARFRLQVERVTAAFAKGKDDSVEVQSSSDHGAEGDDDDDLDPYLDPLKKVYSEAQASQKNAVDENESSTTRTSSSSGNGKNSASWSQLQLWHTLQRLVDSEQDTNMRVRFADLRDDVFHGDMTPLLDLMNEDVLGFEVLDYSSSSSSSQELLVGGGGGVGGGWSWHIKPATPALGRVFQYLVNDSSLKERFLELQKVAERNDKLEGNEHDRQELRRERRRLDMRKTSLLKTVELGKVLQLEDLVRKSIGDVYKTIISEEIAIEKRGLELRKIRESLLQALPFAENDIEKNSTIDSSMPAAIKESKTSKLSPFSDLASIQRQLSAAILHTSGAIEDKEKLFGFRERFEKLSKSEAGITASDVVRLIKKSTGEDLDLEAANSFIRAWDANDDDHLDYHEFVEMLLADPKIARSRGTKKRL
jgi:hypothetical protein